MSNERKRLIDHAYGVRSTDDKWVIGNTVLISVRTIASTLVENVTNLHSVHMNLHL